MKKKVAIGTDHRGFKLKESLKKDLTRRQIPFVDFGCQSVSSVDYPEIGLQVALSVQTGRCFRGVLICGSGIGFSIAANKVRGIRAALCHNLKTARLSRQHNDANILVLDEAISVKTARKMLTVWLETKFEGGRHCRRINQVKAIEKKYFK